MFAPPTVPCHPVFNSHHHSSVLSSLQATQVSVWCGKKAREFSSCQRHLVKSVLFHGQHSPKSVRTTFLSVPPYSKEDGKGTNQADFCMLLSSITPVLLFEGYRFVINIGFISPIYSNKAYKLYVNACYPVFLG